MTSEYSVWYWTLEICVGVTAALGNGLVLAAFWRARRVRRRTNYYVASLALADALVGALGVPGAIATSKGLPPRRAPCLLSLSLLVALCSVSILCLLAVSADRYWAVLHPLPYARTVTTKITIGIICICWALGMLVGSLPLLGWHVTPIGGWSEEPQCYFVAIMDYNFLVFLYIFTIIIPGALLAFFYSHIYAVVIRQMKRMTMLSVVDGVSCHGAGAGTGGTMLRTFGAAQKRELKATQNLAIIVIFFMVSWIPLYTINCVLAFCPLCAVPPALTDVCIVLTHLNSAVNPLLYAYHLRDFRAALVDVLRAAIGLRRRPSTHMLPWATGTLAQTPATPHIQQRQACIKTFTFETAEPRRSSPNGDCFVRYPQPLSADIDHRLTRTISVKSETVQRTDEFNNIDLSKNYFTRSLSTES